MRVMESEIGVPQDDRELIAEIAEGDGTALENLYARYGSQLRRYLWYRLDHDLERAEDVLQETFWNIWRFAHTFRGASSVAAWLFQIARRAALQDRRSASRRPHGHVAILVDEEVELAQRTEDVVVTRLSLLDALRALPPKQREVLYLVFVQGFAPAEVGAILEVPVGTVKSRIRLARRALQATLQRAQLAEDLLP
jgi:RNA polymerase sigma-70 factor, ECF subfamily